MKTAVAVVCLLAGLPASSGLGAVQIPSNLRGIFDVHDPSRVTLCNGRYYVFSTGNNIPTRSSADKQFWVAGPNVFTSPPSWTTNAVPGFQTSIWAPDVLFFNNQYYLYYAISTFGKQVSAIGLATNPTLDPTNASYHWTDQGAVIQSTTGSAYNTIDPCVIFDASSNLWMSFGSFWNGVYMIQLDPSTGKRISANSTVYHLALHADASDSIEASYLFYRSPYYYLFVNWNTCCSGVYSTYNIRVGQSSVLRAPTWTKTVSACSRAVVPVSRGHRQIHWPRPNRHRNRRQH